MINYASKAYNLYDNKFNNNTKAQSEVDNTVTCYVMLLLMK